MTATDRVTEDDLRAWATAQVLTHTPQPPDDHGYTCDERGCGICNAGLDIVDQWVAGILVGDDRGPDADEVTDAREALAALGGRRLRYAYPAKIARGQRARLHLVPPHDRYPELIGRQAICGAAPASGYSEPSPLAWDTHDPGDECPRCTARLRDPDLIDTPGGSL